LKWAALTVGIPSTGSAGITRNVDPQEYYSQTTARSEAWMDSATEPGFAPLGLLMEAARPYLSLGGRALDIGCQGGHQLALLADAFDELVGIDIASYESMWACFPDLRFLVHDIDREPLPFPNGYFRTVIATNIFEHVFDVFGLSREVARVLEPGGTVLISVPNVCCWRSIAALVRGRVPRTGALEYPFTEDQGWDGQHLHYFTHDELSWLLRQVAIEPIETLMVGRLPALKRLAPRYLCGSADIIGRKSLA
jgi:SAM-dependent methyltransferase